jgi:hypothetical protein
MAIVEGRWFDKSREIPGITANLLTGSKRAIRVLRTSQRQQNSIFYFDLSNISKTIFDITSNATKNTIRKKKFK